MEFVINRCPPAPAVATGLGRTFVISRTDIRDEHGAVLGRVEVRTKQAMIGAPPRMTEYALCQHGTITAVFQRGTDASPELWLTYDDRRMRVQPSHHYLCEEIRARTELPWFPPGQCLYSVDNSVDPVSALFLFQMLENLDDECL